MPREGNYLKQAKYGLLLCIRRQWVLLLIPLLLIGLPGCKKEVVPKAFFPRSEHEAYTHSLEAANLSSTALGIEWSEAATRSLDSPFGITTPFQEGISRKDSTSGS